MTHYREVANKVDTIAGIAFLIGALLCAGAILLSFIYPFMVGIAFVLFVVLMGHRLPIRGRLRSLARQSLDESRCPWCGSSEIHLAGTDRYCCPECGERFSTKGDRVIERDAKGD